MGTNRSPTIKRTTKLCSTRATLTSCTSTPLSCAAAARVKAQSKMRQAMILSAARTLFIVPPIVPFKERLLPLLRDYAHRYRSSTAVRAPTGRLLAYALSRSCAGPDSYGEGAESEFGVSYNSNGHGRR